MFEAVCPNGHRLHVPAEHAGLKLRCPACNAVFQLSLPRDAAASPGAAPSPSTSVHGGTGTPASSGPASSLGPSHSPSTVPVSTVAVSGEPTASPIASAPSLTGGEANTRRWTDAVPSAPASATRPSPVLPPLFPRDRNGVLQAVTRGSILLGLFLLLTAKGCGSLGAKNVARLQSRVDLQQRAFDEEREQALLDVQSQIDQPNVTPTLRSELQKRLEETQTKYDKQRRDLQTGEWRQAANVATRAVGENRSNEYAREWLFVVGTLLFSLGALAIALVGQGPERWIGCTLLGIVLFSVYIGGMAWTTSSFGVGR